MTLGALIGNNHAFLETQSFFEFPYGLVHVLLAQIQISHDFVIINELLLRSVEGREHVIGFIDHFESVVQLPQIELDHGVMGILLERFLIGTDDFIGLS